MAAPWYLRIAARLANGDRISKIDKNESLEHILKTLQAQMHRSELRCEDRFRLAEKITMLIYPKFKFSEFGRLWLEDSDFFDVYQKTMDRENWHSCDRKFFLKELLRTTRLVQGDYAECGTYNGGSALFICDAAKTYGRTVHLFDSFMGLSKPQPIDGDYWREGRLSCDVETLRRTLEDYDNYAVYEGWIPERFTDVAQLRFSFVHIDVDLYQPTYDSLVFFYPRMARGGVIVLDDHGFMSCPGARAAAIEYFTDKPEPVIDTPTGQGLVFVRHSD